LFEGNNYCSLTLIKLKASPKEHNNNRSSEKEFNSSNKNDRSDSKMSFNSNNSHGQVLDLNHSNKLSSEELEVEYDALNFSKLPSCNFDQKLFTIDKEITNEHLDPKKALIPIDLDTLEDYSSLDFYQKIFSICTIQKIKNILEIKNEVEKLIASTNNVNMHNSKFHELLKLDIFNELYDNLYKIINKFYFKNILLKTNFQEKIENVLISHWKLKNNFTEDCLLNLDQTESNQSDDNLRKISILSTTSMSYEDLNIARFKSNSFKKV